MIPGHFDSLANHTPSDLQKLPSVVRTSPSVPANPICRAIGPGSFSVPKWTMTKQALRIRQAIHIAILLGTASAAALANQSPMLFSGAKTPLCYCHCKPEAGKQCTKMCELPQYENRWWANSCHKKSAAAGAPSSPASNSGSRKTNRTEEARR